MADLPSCLLPHWPQELLIALALRNRDRAGLIWPLLHEYLAACTAADHGEGLCCALVCMQRLRANPAGACTAADQGE